MSPSLVLSASLLTHLASAYTQVNVASPFMNKNIDPIVFPVQYDKSHLHSFYGSVAVTISTNTSAELQEGCTNAENPNDLSTYWVPTVLYTTDGGKTYNLVPVMRFSACCNLGETEVEIVFPQDLEMVAGVATATTQAGMNANAKADWVCEGSEGGALDVSGFPG